MSSENSDDGHKISHGTLQAAKGKAWRDFEELLHQSLLARFSGPLPNAVLPAIRDLTFADGACFVKATESGCLSLHYPSGVNCISSVTSELRSPYWECCAKGNRVLCSHMSEPMCASQGIAIPGGGSVMIVPAKSHLHEIRRVSVMVWRSQTSQHAFSKDAFQVWDMEELLRAVSILVLAVRAQAAINTVAALRAVSEVASDYHKVLAPWLARLYHHVVLEEPIPRLAIREDVEKMEEALLALEKSIAIRSVTVLATESGE